jgi:nudix-type nucleoside diphosphatase (YffH/AdpP family)
MADLFLHDPIGDMLAPVLGPCAVQPARPADLADHAVRYHADRIRIALVAEPGAAAPGRLIAPSAPALARLDFVMAAMGAARAGARTVGGEPAEAYLFATAAAERRAWSAQAWSADWQAFLAEALEEVMGHFGRRPAETMPGLLHGIGFRAQARAMGPRGGAPVRLRAGFGAADVEPVERTFAYARYLGIEDHRLRHRRFDGAMSEVLDRAVLTSGDAVTVLPFDPRRDSVLLIEQFRAGAHARRDPWPWFLETVAGRCDPLEAPEDTARREAVEEAGVTLGRLERVAAYYPSPGVMAEYITAFVGEADLGRAGGTLHGIAEEHEDIRTLVVPLDAALEAVASGEVNNAPLLVTLLWLAQHRRRLAAAWG